MGTMRSAPSISGRQATATSSEGMSEGMRHRTSALARFLAAVIMGIVLLALSALIHSAAAATLGGGWWSLGAVWIAAVIATLLAVYTAPSHLAAWRRMCLVNGVASLLLLGFGTAELPRNGYPPELTVPIGPVLGVAIAAGMLVVIGSVLALLFFAAWHLLPRHRPRAHRHA